MLRNSCSRSCTSHRAGAGRGAQEPYRHDRCVAWALGGDGCLTDELVVAERARDQVEQPAADQALLLAEIALCGLAHGAHPELVVEDQEGGRLTRHRVARA